MSNDVKHGKLTKLEEFTLIGANIIMDPEKSAYLRGLGFHPSMDKGIFYLYKEFRDINELNNSLISISSSHIRIEVDNGSLKNDLTVIPIVEGDLYKFRTQIDNVFNKYIVK